MIKKEKNILTEVVTLTEEVLKKNDLSLEIEIVNEMIRYNIKLLKDIKKLISIKSEEGVVILLRSYLEMCFQILYILNDEELIKQRALSYKYFSLFGKINLEPTEDIVAKMCDKEKEPERYEALKQEVDKIRKNKTIKNELSQDIYKEVRDEIIRKDKKLPKNSYNPKFYKYFNEENLKNLSKLCEYINQQAYYYINYGGYSRCVHGSDSFSFAAKHIYKDIFNLLEDLLKKYAKNILKTDEKIVIKKLYDIKYKHGLLRIKFQNEL